MKEYIICSAIWYKDLESQHYPPTNVDRGTVVCGHRHAHCIYITKALTGLRTVTYADDGVGEFIQGFLTNKNRFVDREEAMIIARNANQVSKDTVHNRDLFSEDLY